MRSIAAYYEWLSGGELPVFDTIVVKGKHIDVNGASIYYPRSWTAGGRRGWRPKPEGSRIVVSMGDYIKREAVAQYVRAAVQELSPTEGSIAVIMRGHDLKEVSVGIAHLVDEPPPGGFELPNSIGGMNLEKPEVTFDDECPGKGKCHGCLQWCNECGDVDFTCDFPDCDAHPRLEELEEELKTAKRETADLAQRWRDSEKEAGELQETVDRARSERGRGQRMVPRRRP